MRKQKPAIKLIVPYGIHVMVIREKSREDRHSKKNPYYCKSSLYDENGEPSIERDYEG